MALATMLDRIGVGQERYQAWVTQMRAGARSGCTRIEWFSVDGQPRVSYVQNEAIGSVFELEGSKAPHNDVGQRWVVTCKRATS